MANIPPRPPDTIGNSIHLSHFSFELDWADLIDRLKSVFDVRKDGRILTELQVRAAPPPTNQQDLAGATRNKLKLTDGTATKQGGGGEATASTDSAHSDKQDVRDDEEKNDAAGDDDEDDDENEEDDMKNWKVIYSAYDSHYMYKELRPDTEYEFRMRFKNKHGWGGFSKPISFRTLKQPMTGENIHKAIRTSNSIELRRVLQSGEADIEAQDAQDYTPLMSAALRGETLLVQILGEFGADLDRHNKSHKTALMLAAFKGHCEVIRLLVDELRAPIHSTDASGLTALHYATDGEQRLAVRELIRLGANVNYCDHLIGWSPLNRLAGLKTNGNATVARELLQNGAVVDLQDVDGKSPLHNAIINNHVNLVDLLMSAGARHELTTKTGHSALQLASSLDLKQAKSVLDSHIERREERKKSRVSIVLDN